MSVLMCDMNLQNIALAVIDIYNIKIPESYSTKVGL